MRWGVIANTAINLRVPKNQEIPCPAVLLSVFTETPCIVNSCSYRTIVVYVGVFWIVLQCYILAVGQCFGGTYCPHLY
jgi:hypothetical protein